MNARARPRGFTLIELMVALAIAALLLLLGMPSFTAFVRNSEIRSTSEALINGLRAAAAEAARRNKKVTFELASATAADWQFWVLDDDDVTHKILQTYAKAESGALSKIAITPVGQLTVTFDGLGRVVDPGTNNHVRLICIYIGAAANCGSPVDDFRPLQIVVDDPNPPAAGKPRGLRMCDPDPALVPATDPRAC